MDVGLVGGVVVGCGCGVVAPTVGCGGYVGVGAVRAAVGCDCLHCRVGRRDGTAADAVRTDQLVAKWV